MIARRTAVMLAAAVLVAAAVAGCDAPEPSLGAPVSVTIYARVAPPTQVWVGIQPLANPPFEVGFNGRDVGVACTTAAAGSQVAILSGSPARGAVNVVGIVGTVAPAASGVSGGQALWLDVAADGSLTSGSGVPAWWPPGGGGC